MGELCDVHVDHLQKGVQLSGIGCRFTDLGSVFHEGVGGELFVEGWIEFVQKSDAGC